MTGADHNKFKKEKRERERGRERRWIMIYSMQENCAAFHNFTTLKGKHPTYLVVLAKISTENRRR